MDEPFSGLDPVNVDLLKDAVLELKKKGTTIIFSSHRMEHAEELCENLCIMDRGKPVVHGSLKEIKQSFGKKNLVIHSDFDMQFLAEVEGVTKLRPTSEGVRLQIAEESVAETIQKLVFAKGFVRKFELEEPTLHDIFVEKVGGVVE